MNRADAVVASELELRPMSPLASNTLRMTYEDDRAARDAANPPIFDPNRCRYCIKPWRRFGGTKFEGHVACAVSREFQHTIVDLLDTGASYASVGLQIGVSPNIVRAWWRAVKWLP